MKALGWILLFMMAWPVFILVWWVAPEKRPRFVQQIVAFAQAHPKATAAAGLVFGLVGGIGNLVHAEFGAAVFGLGVAAGCGFLLGRWRWLEVRARHAEIVARADLQHAAVLDYDDFGVYGTRDRPKL